MNAHGGREKLRVRRSHFDRVAEVAHHLPGDAEEQFALLRGYACDTAQGYLLGRPLLGAFTALAAAVTLGYVDRVETALRRALAFQSASRG